MTGHDDPGDGSLAPTLLVSMPQLTDPNFRRTVVLLCQHNAEGAFGLVLNRPTGKAAALAVQLDPPVTRANSLQIWVGGPVEPERGCILLAEELPDAECVRVRDGLYLSASPALLRRLLEEKMPPRGRVLMGYAGWGPGQLEDELRQSAWLIADIDLDLVFDVNPAAMWETAIRRLGADPAALQASSGVH